jgi:hypothetical protein
MRSVNAPTKRLHPRPQTLDRQDTNRSTRTGAITFGTADTTVVIYRGILDSTGDSMANGSDLHEHDADLLIYRRWAPLRDEGLTFESEVAKPLAMRK